MIKKYRPGSHRTQEEWREMRKGERYLFGNAFSRSVGKYKDGTIHIEGEKDKTREEAYDFFNKEAPFFFEGYICGVERVINLANEMKNILEREFGKIPEKISNENPTR